MHGYDVGYDEAGFGAASINQKNGPNTFPIVVTRTTSDGVFRLKQIFTWRPRDREVLIKMTVENLSGSDRSDVRLIRFFDGDMNGTAAGDIYHTTGVSVLARQDFNSFFGLMLSALTPGNPLTAAGIRPFSTWDPTDCTPGSNVNNPGDHVGFVIYNLGTIAAGTQDAVRVLYRGF